MMALSWLFWADWNQVDGADVLILIEYDWAVSVLLEINLDVVKYFLLHLS